MYNKNTRNDLMVSSYLPYSNKLTASLLHPLMYTSFQHVHVNDYEPGLNGKTLNAKKNDKFIYLSSQMYLWKKKTPEKIISLW